MEALLAVAVGVLFGTGVYMMLRRSLIKIVLGLGLLSNAANLLIFTAAGLRRGSPPIIAEGEKTLTAGAADPLPQALILTAIVITFGVQAFALVLIYTAYRIVGSDDPDAMVTTDLGPAAEADAILPDQEAARRGAQAGPAAHGPRAGTTAPEAAGMGGRDKGGRDKGGRDKGGQATTQETGAPAPRTPSSGGGAA